VDNTQIEVFLQESSEVEIMKNIIRKIFYRSGKTTIKKVEDMTPEEIKQMRLQATRATLHRAVELGLYDDDIKEIK